MSADNFYLVRKSQGCFFVTMLFASDYEHGEPWPPLSSGNELFNTFAEVQAFLNSNYAEYPPVYDFPVKVVEE